MIRPVQSHEIDRLIDLCEKHARYEGNSYERAGKKEMLTEALFCSQPVMHCAVIIHHEILVGYATYMQQYSTWDARFYMYLDCLYLDSTVRGRGFGKQLMEWIRLKSAESGCAQIQWQTPVFNGRAIKFYNKLGAVYEQKQRFFWETFKS